MIKHNLEKSFFGLTVQEGYTSMLVEWRRGGWNRKRRDLPCSNCKHRTERANRKWHEFLHSQSLPGLSFGRTEMELIGSIWRLEVSSLIVVGKSFKFPLLLYRMRTVQMLWTEFWQRMRRGRAAICISPKAI